MLESENRNASRLLTEFICGGGPHVDPEIRPLDRPGGSYLRHVMRISLKCSSFNLILYKNASLLKPSM